MQRLPCLANAKVVGTYSGLRPATEHRDYQITQVEGENWITVGGIRSTGLTGSSGIGEYVAGLYLGISAAVLKIIHSDTRVTPPYQSAPLHSGCKNNAPIPSLESLAADYQERGDGTVEIFGQRHKVSHPISSFGLATMHKA